ncbi:hypothetical protein, secreted [gut metagenome]|uniref:DUF4468 domain-containing protein n=1 Tax=gut metagenome TaxID=749906 RepID=J9GXG7_9ZZZZ
MNQTMKKLLLMLMLCLPLWASAQTEPKYLAGAVPMKEGKVSFQQEFRAPSLSKQEIFDLLLKWGQTRFQPKDDFHARVLYSNETEGTIAIGGEEYLVFSSTALSLDRTRIYYQLYLTCQPGQVNAEITRIRYWYDENRDGGQHYNAEEWINDKMALNKKQTKLAPICGKFRRETIDLKDELFKTIQDELAHAVMASTPMTASSQTQAATTASQTQAATTASQVIPATKLTPAQPVDRDAHIRSSARITLTASGEQLDLGKESWGGFGQLFGKEVVFCLLNQHKKLGNLLLEQSEDYTVSFYDEGQSEPWLTVRCKKMMKQEVSGEEAQKMNAGSDGSQSYNLYVGEVVK